MNTSTMNQSDDVSSTEKFVAVCVTAGVCSLLTVCGNLFVILAFVANRGLRNFSNYLILNLAISDIIIGLFSMNVFTVYNLHNSVWTMGRGMCKAWLTVDYVVSNTSVMNLLVICIDRYIAITSPVKYRQRCTTRVAFFVICATWIISFLLWAPAILLWDIISPKQSENDLKCSIPFLGDSALVTILTALVAFYLPAMSMCALYRRVIVKIYHRTSNISSMISRATEAIETRFTSPLSAKQLNDIIMKRDSRGMSNETVDSELQKFGNEKKDEAPDLLDEEKICEETHQSPLSKFSTTMSNCSDCHMKRCCENDLKENMSTPCECNSEIPADFPECPRSLLTCVNRSVAICTNHSNLQGDSTSCHVEEAGNCSKIENKLKKQEHIKYPSNSSFASHSIRLNREKRATTLLKSILICFIALWLPYNIIVVVTALCPDCSVHKVIWELAYWLCYLNSTVNPFCYGYCNENFQHTFKALLTTKWWTSKGRRDIRRRQNSKKHSAN